ncbi:TonB-dependent receptor domain-containing protein [Phenylobacterium sp. J367]|uniref:TonB-dependent receptor domain-containing protein n=1 Tax=Phenylobacterium sp. J367 TaxID=2898435 RepID=UPI002151E6A0|nr:TonB-dependent receptor [Phenylobacterium sp. J367]MCR5877170.1 TonB-dependent receptor [Phenylobacterium sp. J367]
MDGLSLRGTWGTSFRAPSLVDTGNLNFVFVSAVPDPANGNRLINQVNITGSNPNLKPEEAETYSVGFDFQPTFLPDLRVSATYYKVDYKDRILGIAASLATENTYRQFVTRNPDPAFIQSLFNSGWLVSTPIDPATVGVFIDQRRNNIGTLTQDGIDIDARYRFATSFGDVTVGVAHSEILHIKQASNPTAAPIDVVDTFGNPLRSRGRASVMWANGPWAANLYYNYGGAYRNTAIVPNVKAEAQQTVDVGLIWRSDDGPAFLKGVRVGLNVQNVFDEKPPIVLNTSNAWDNTTANAIGRFMAIDITKSW